MAIDLKGTGILDADGDILTRSGGNPVGISRAALAADAAFTGTYAPKASDRLWLGASEFSVSLGASLGAGGQRFPAWLFDAATFEQVYATFVPPIWWATFDVSLYWSNAGAGAGDVFWEVVYSSRGATEDLTVGDVTGLSAAVAAPAQDVLKVTSGATGVAVVDELWHIRIRRHGDNAGDTLANDASLLGVLLTRAS